MNDQYIYPQNLKSQAKLWLWSLRDIAFLGVALVISVVALVEMKFVIPLALTFIFGFLTIRLEETTVLDFIHRGVRYFITTQQYFEWKFERKEVS